MNKSVVDSSYAKCKDLAFAIVAPEWAYKQQITLTAVEQKMVDKIKDRLGALKLPAPGENAHDFFRRAQ